MYLPESPRNRVHAIDELSVYGKDSTSAKRNVSDSIAENTPCIRSLLRIVSPREEEEEQEKKKPEVAKTQPYSFQSNRRQCTIDFP
jgi:hypothetical protein